MTETHDWVSVSYPWGERDVWFEHNEEKCMFRHDATTGKFFTKAYGQDDEREIPHHDKAMFEAECGNNRIISEETYWRTRAFDRFFGSGDIVSAVLQAPIDPEEVIGYLDLDFDAERKAVTAVCPVHLRVIRIRDRMVPLYRDGFDENAVTCRWNTEQRTPKSKLRNDYLHQLDQAIRLVEWDQLDFGAVWIGGRPSIVWDDTGIHVLTDEDFLHRMPGSFLLDKLDQHNIRYRQHQRKLENLTTNTTTPVSGTPTPKPRLVQQAEWVEVYESETSGIPYLNKQESIEAVLEFIKRSPGCSIYAADAGVYVPRLHESLRLPDILDHLEETGAIRAEPGKKSTLYYPT